MGWDLGLGWDYDKWDGTNGIWDGIWVGWDMGLSFPFIWMVSISVSKQIILWSSDHQLRRFFVVMRTNYD